MYTMLLRHCTQLGLISFSTIVHMWLSVTCVCDLVDVPSGVRKERQRMLSLCLRNMTTHVYCVHYMYNVCKLELWQRP